MKKCKFVYEEGRKIVNFFICIGSGIYYSQAFLHLGQDYRHLFGVVSTKVAVENTATFGCSQVCSERVY